jgi:uncharacterized membrane protein
VTAEAPATESWRRGLLYPLAALFVGMGVLHFVVTDVFVSVMPAYVPYHREMVWLSGLFEIGLGLAVLPERTRPWAGLGLVLLLIAVFPANVNMALHDVPPESPPPRWLMWGRLPLQALLIAWAWWVTRPATTPRGG